MPDDPLIRWETDGGATLPSDDDSGAASRSEPAEDATVRHAACPGVIVHAPAGTTD
ncbi:MAG: hypothetical protein ACRDNR_06035 [Gaiellaceae bacterium]